MPSALFESLHLQTSKQMIPAFLYGTAWKKEKTADLVYQAICSGFTAIDTAAQPKHYREDLVGDGIRRALDEGKIRRDDLFIQTKFTSISGQDPKNLPYNPRSSIADQVHASIASSLHHLRHSSSASGDPLTNSAIIDCLVFHSPFPNFKDTLESWQVAQTYVPSHIRHLGISNVSLDDFKQIYAAAEIKPSVVQNRFYKQTGYDALLRRFCNDHGIIYQAFWTLTANPSIVKSKEVVLLGQQAGISPAQAFYCLLLGLDNLIVLNGTTNEEHMKNDWAAVAQMEAWVQKHPHQWESSLKAFQATIGD